MRLAIIGCGAAKLGRPAPARELYTGNLFRAALAYVEGESFDKIRILSARHGLVRPDRVLEPYDLHLDQLGPWARADLGERIRAKLARRYPGALEITLLAGAGYAELLQPAPAEWTIVEPLKGLMVGQRLQWFARRKAQRPAAACGVR